MSRNEQSKFHGNFRVVMVVHFTTAKYRLLRFRLYNAYTFQARTTTTLTDWVQELFSIFKLYYFPYDGYNRRQYFFRNHLVQRVRLPSPCMAFQSYMLEVAIILAGRRPKFALNGFYGIRY
jgi:hypothetical protein